MDAGKSRELMKIALYGKSHNMWLIYALILVGVLFFCTILFIIFGGGGAKATPPPSIGGILDPISSSMPVAVDPIKTENNNLIYTPESVDTAPAPVDMVEQQRTLMKIEYIEHSASIQIMEKDAEISRLSSDLAKARVDRDEWHNKYETLRTDYVRIMDLDTAEMRKTIEVGQKIQNLCKKNPTQECLDLIF